MKFSLPQCSAVLVMAGMGFAVPAIASHEVPVLIAQATPATTFMTAAPPDGIAIQIQDGEFFFHDILVRSYGNLFTATDGRVRVNYDLDTGRVVVINAVTGTEFYNYIFTEASRAPAPSRSSASSNAPQSTTLTPIGNGQISAYITDGEFSFSGALTRTSGNVFVGEDGRVRVMYDQSAGRIVIINVVTGTEFYNYIYSTANEGAL
ncbi:MAG TPA: hypothetical protein IGR64_06030 [Leptolyngbyaceae cyanobacterium M65_K2018_010]|nr:hypothetical protein [Leptolyngbyaceae cyanobacterium M65_K2018_010]